MKWIRLPLVVVAGLAVCALPGCERGGSGSADRPNIILIVVDTMRADFIRAHCASALPAVRAFCQDSVAFENARAQASWTVPSISSLLYSRYPSEHGYGSRTRTLATLPQSLPQAFARAGWRTAAFLDVDFPPWRNLFDTYEAVGEGQEARKNRAFGDTAGRVFETGLAWLQAAGRPAFVLLHTQELHDYYLAKPYGWQDARRRYPSYAGPVAAWTPLPPGPDAAQRLLDLLGTGDAEDFEFLRETYDAGARTLDRDLGRFLQTLSSTGLAGNTIVVLTADHGEGFDAERRRFHHGGRLHDDLLRVPLIVRWPGRVGPSSRADPVGLIDVMPTLLGLAGVPIPRGVRGRSLLRVRGRLVRFWADPVVIADEDPMADIFAEESVYRVLNDGRRVESDIRQYATYSRGMKLIVDGPHVELYDTNLDFSESSNLWLEQGRGARPLVARLEDFIRSVEHGSLVASPAVDQALRSLGYVR